MHERRFNRNIEFLRDPARLQLLEVQRVATLSLEKLDRAQSVLDIGTGSGVFAEEFARRGLQVAGVDANSEMVEAASAHVPAAEFNEGTAELLPFPDASFDLVFMGLLLHETDDRLKALKEAHRVSKQRLAVLEWRYGDLSFGPPIDDRMSGEKIKELALEAGWKNTRSIALSHLDLFLMDH